MSFFPIATNQKNKKKRQKKHSNFCNYHIAEETSRGESEMNMIH